MPRLPCCSAKQSLLLLLYSLPFKDSGHWRATPPPTPAQPLAAQLGLRGGRGSGKRSHLPRHDPMCSPSRGGPFGLAGGDSSPLLSTRSMWPAHNQASFCPNICLHATSEQGPGSAKCSPKPAQEHAVGESFPLLLIAVSSRPQAQTPGPRGCESCLGGATRGDWACC